ncbi:MAG: ribosome recycling factor [Phycisphaerales bacterium]|nr:ribosome recycling factor [Phycisphaerales bacterium]
MDIDMIVLEAEDRMDKSVEHLQRELRGMRTGRASTALLEYVKVEYFGSFVDLRELAGISVAEATMLYVKPFDPGARLAIVKAIETAGLGLNPQSDGQGIRIPVPAPSAERRRQLATQARKAAEDTRVAIRNERRDANKHIDAALADTKVKISEDQAEHAKKQIDDMTKAHTTKVDEMTEKKVTEVETV